MVVLLVLVGLTFGIVAAALALWFGASILVALIVYAMAGAIATLVAAMIVFLAGESTSPDADWGELPKKQKNALSA